MKPLHDLRPPRLPLAFFRWFCRPDYLEEIEGDLLEQFYLNAERLGSDRARWIFRGDVLRLCRPEIILNHPRFAANFTEMKKENWLSLATLNLLFALFVILPFMPGPPNKLSIGLSALGQFTSFFGLLLLPIGLVWAIFEFKKRSGKRSALNNWSSGFYFAIAATVISVLIYSLLIIGFAFMEGEGWWVVCVAVPPLVWALWKIVPGIRNLRKQSATSFHPAPFYLLSVPVIALLARLLLMEPVADFSRENAIRQSQTLLSAIENFHAKEGRYPNSLADLQPVYLADIPKPNFMGIKDFRYEKTADAYNLFFWQHLGATEELVMYNKNNQHQVKGHYASGEAGVANWRYYWLD